MTFFRVLGISWLALFVLVLDAEADCTGAPAAQVLDRMTAIARLHNCEIEVVARNTSDGLKRYMVLVNRLRAPLSNLTFELEVDAGCPLMESRELEYRTIRHSFGYRNAKEDHRLLLQLQMGGSRLPVSFMIQEIDRATRKISRRIVCSRAGEDL